MDKINLKILQSELGSCGYARTGTPADLLFPRATGGLPVMAHMRRSSLNKVLIVGNLVKDPELRYTSVGVPVVNFRIASNKKFKDNLEILQRGRLLHRSGGMAGAG